MNNYDYYNYFDIDGNYCQHYCYYGCYINFKKFTCYIHRNINKYYTNNKFDFNRILGKLDGDIPIDKIYYVELTI